MVAAMEEDPSAAVTVLEEVTVESEEAMVVAVDLEEDMEDSEEDMVAVAAADAIFEF